jgi:hypothetical protein
MVFSTAVFADATGDDVVITFDAANTITLVGTTHASITQEDFSFIPVNR